MLRLKIFFCSELREIYTEESIPMHACLRLIANSEQVLSSLTSRRLLTYEKIAEPDINSTDDVQNIGDVSAFRKK